MHQGEQREHLAMAKTVERCQERGKLGGGDDKPEDVLTHLS
jgi:hypothetical protein